MPLGEGWGGLEKSGGEKHGPRTVCRDSREGLNAVVGGVTKTFDRTKKKKVLVHEDQVTDDLKETKGKNSKDAKHLGGSRGRKTG